MVGVICGEDLTIVIEAQSDGFRVSQSGSDNHDDIFIWSRDKGLIMHDQMAMIWANHDRTVWMEFEIWFGLSPIKTLFLDFLEAI